MAILVTRPHPDDETTATGLRARGFEVLLAPMLRFEPLAFHDDADAPYGAVIVTSANALRGIEPHLKGSQWLKLPLFAVGEHTAAAARNIGFEQVISAKGDAASLRELVTAGVKAKALKKTSPLLYLAGADLARDLAGELGERGFTVVTQTTYRMVPLSRLPREVCDAFAANQVDAVLHYSRRSARAFLSRFAPRASKYRRCRSRNAASRQAWPRSSATPGPPRSWWRHRRTKMPCSRLWTVLCAPDRATRHLDLSRLASRKRLKTKTRTGQFVRISGEAKEEPV